MDYKSRIICFQSRDEFLRVGERSITSNLSLFKVALKALRDLIASKLKPIAK